MKLKPILFLIFLVILFGCKSPEIKVGYLMCDNLSARWQKDYEIFNNRIVELGGVVKLKNAKNDEQVQYQFAKELISSGVKLLVIVPVDNIKAGKIVQLAHENGVKVISYDRLIVESDVDFYISFDNVEVGKLQAEYLTSLHVYGNYALINGPKTDNNALFLRKGQLEILSPFIKSGEINIIFDQYASDWSSDQGYLLTKKLLELGTTISSIIYGNDLLATGGIKAISEAKVPYKIYIGSQDADLSTCHRILLDQQEMTVYKPIVNLAKTAANYAYKIIKDEKIETDIFIQNGEYQIPTVLLPAMIVNKANMKMTVISDGYLDEKLLYDTTSTIKY